MLIFLEKVYKKYRLGLSYLNNIRHRVICRGLPRCGRFVDVGCGEGFFLYKFLKYYKLAVGIDKDIKKFEFFKDAKLKLNFLNGDAANLPLKNSSFDVALCGEMLEHVESPNRVIEEIARILKNDGIFILTAPSENCPPAPGHVRPGFSVAELTDMLNDNNFEILKVYKLDRGIFYDLHRLYNKKMPRIFRALIFPLFYLVGFLDHFSKGTYHDICMKAIKR